MERGRRGVKRSGGEEEEMVRKLEGERKREAVGPSGSNYAPVPVFKVSNFPRLQPALLAVTSNQRQQICGRKRRIAALSSSSTSEGSHPR